MTHMNESCHTLVSHATRMRELHHICELSVGSLPIPRCTCAYIHTHSFSLTHTHTHTHTHTVISDTHVSHATRMKEFNHAFESVMSHLLHMHARLHTWICTHKYVMCTYILIYLYIHVCIYIYTCVYTYRDSARERKGEKSLCM